MGGKSKKPKQRVTEYRMSVQYGICQGPVDSLSRVVLNEKTAWEGAQVIEGAFTVNNIDLFGGIKKEGGVDGRVYFQPGDFAQKLSGKAAGKLGLTPNTAPAYRGLCTALFTDRPPPEVPSGDGFLSDLFQALFLKNRPRGYDRPGFYWTANQPFIPPAWFTVTRIPKSWYPETARISEDADKPLSIYFAIDDSGSMKTGARLATMKTAMSGVLDLIAQGISSFGLSIDIGIAEWGNTSFRERVFESATVANIESLRSFVNAINGNGDGTNFNTAATGAKNFFESGLSKTFARRVFVFITDGEPFPEGSDDDAETTMADMLNRSSGQFRASIGTAVDCYGINIELPDVLATAKLDNTSSDDVPVVSSDDPSELLSAVQNALFAGQRGDANPIHMIRECLTDRSWGMGAPESCIDDVSFRAAADALFQEKFGLSMIWTQQAEIEKFIREILDHIEANLIVDPADGLFKIKLIRDDIDPDTLPVFDESNSVVDSFQIRSPT
ncbi:MAG: vWA domain-containing protein, partial [Geminicoccaceae bacterium]